MVICLGYNVWGHIHCTLLQGFEYCLSGTSYIVDGQVKLTPASPSSKLTLCKNATVHQVTTMLATSKNVSFLGHNHLLTTVTDDPVLSLPPECQLGHLVPCMPILFSQSLCLQITRSDIRLHTKWAVSLVVADLHGYFCSTILLHPVISFG